MEVRTRAGTCARIKRKGNLQCDRAVSLEVDEKGFRALEFLFISEEPGQSGPD